MTRREVVVIVGCAATGLAFRMNGCEKNRDTLAVLLQTLGGAIAQLATVMGQTQISDRIRHHTTAAVNMLKAWQPGQASGPIILALNLIVDDLKELAEERFRPLVTLALGTIAAIMEKIRTLGTGQAEPPHTDVHLTQPPVNSEEFKHTWDAIRAGSINMEQAPVL